MPLVKNLMQKLLLKAADTPVSHWASVDEFLLVPLWTLQHLACKPQCSCLKHATKLIPEKDGQGNDMATNPPSGDGHRNGMVRQRSQVLNPKTGIWTKRGPNGQFMDGKQDGTPFKGVRKEK